MSNEKKLATARNAKGKLPPLLKRFLGNGGNKESAE
jgi:hypothetical protein